MSKNNDCFEIGLLAGLIGGLLAGIAFAPDEGSKSVKKIRETISDFGEKHEEDIEITKKKLSEVLDLLRYNTERQFRILVNKIRAKKLRKAKEREKYITFSSDIN